MRRVSLFLRVLCLLFCLPSLSFSATSGALSGVEKARLFVEVMAPVFETHLSQDFSPVKEGTAFSSLVLDEEKEEARFEAREFFDATGLKLSCVVGREDAVLTLAESLEGRRPGRGQGDPRTACVLSRRREN